MNRLPVLFLAAAVLVTLFACGKRENEGPFAPPLPAGSATTTAKTARPANSGPSVKVTSASPTATSKTFDLVATDPDGARDLRGLQLLISPRLVASDACLMKWERAKNALYLQSDDGKSLLGPIHPGTGTLENHQCTLDGSKSTLTESTDELKLTFAVTFKIPVNAMKTFVRATDSNSTSDWQEVK